jgi:hypothetical protein
MREADRRLSGTLNETFKWLLAPAQEVNGKGRIGSVFWEEASLPTGQANFASAITKSATDSEWLITEWAPIHLATALKRFYWKEDSPHAEAPRIWSDTCRYVYLPRLSRKAVFEETMHEGIKFEDYFAYAEGADPDEGYTGLLYGQEGKTYLTDGALLILPSAARTEIARKKPKSTTPESESSRWEGSDDELDRPDRTSEGLTSSTSKGAKRFYASVELDPLTGFSQFKDINDSVIAHLVQTQGAKVRVRLDIEASHSEGFDKGVQRTVRENANTLGVSNPSFEED